MGWYYFAYAICGNCSWNVLNVKQVYITLLFVYDNAVGLHFYRIICFRHFYVGRFDILAVSFFYVMCVCHIFY